jgi:hypothetical protein
MVVVGLCIEFLITLYYVSVRNDVAGALYYLFNFKFIIEADRHAEDADGRPGMRDSDMHWCSRPAG